MDAAYPATLSKADSLALRYGEDSIPAAGPWNGRMRTDNYFFRILYRLE